VRGLRDGGAISVFGFPISGESKSRTPLPGNRKSEIASDPLRFAPVRRLLATFVLLTAFSCAAPTPAPEPAPEPPPVTTPAPAATLGTVEVTASALNVRRERSTTADVVEQLRRGARLTVLEADEAWTHVRLPNGEEGWVASRFVAAPGASSSSSSSRSSTTTPRRRGGCPPDSDFAFTETPTLTFSDSPKKGMVVVDATVNTNGTVTSTKVVSNTTGDESLAFLAVREIRSAKFSPPIRNCVPRAFIYTYRRTF
jgi:TonB family protein